MSFHARDEAKAMVTGVMKGPLKAAGFRKRAMKWSRGHGDVTQLVHVQFNRYTDWERATFAVNLGVFHPAFYEARHGRTPPALTALSPGHCEPSIRLGRLHTGDDHWWKIERGVAMGPVARDFAAAFEAHALKWLVRFSTMEDIYDEMIRQQRHFDAAMAARVLERDNVPELLELALEHAPHDNFADFVRRWMAENGFGGA